MYSTNNLGLSDIYGHFINNEFVTPSTQTIEARASSTGELLSRFSRGGKEDVDRAVAAARAAFPAWSTTGANERAAMLLKLADALEADIERHAAIDAADIGRMLFETRIDQLIAIGQYRYFAAAGQTYTGIAKAIPGGQFFSRREPLGVCAQIIPWNVPAIMVALKLAPALAAGNTVVLKPDENASLSTLEFAKKIAAIFPAGVVNIVTGVGEETGQALANHPGINKLAFTGSSAVGRIIAHAGAEALLPVTLELGGKSPNIVFPDIEDIDAVVDNAAFASTYCNGQSCLAGTRLFVHDDIFDTFMDKLVNTFSSARVGSPFDPAASLSCLVNEKQGKQVLNYIAAGHEDGAKLHCGGNRATVSGHEAGYFIEPTIFEAKNSMRIAQEEIFGPVLSVIRWNDYEEMITQANDVRYGLASGIYTSNITAALETADRLQAGMVWINQYFNMQDGAPFGGYKDSGLGREFAAETLSHYTQNKTITISKKVPSNFFSR